MPGLCTWKIFGSGHFSLSVFQIGSLAGQLEKGVVVFVSFCHFGQCWKSQVEVSWWGK